MDDNANLPVNPIQNLNLELEVLSFLADQSADTVEEKTSSLRGRMVTKLASQKEHLPKWAARHIEIHQQLKQAINEADAKGVKITHEVQRALEHSNDAIRKISTCVNYNAFLAAIAPPETSYTDETKLLKPLQPTKQSIPSNKKDWELHFGLLASSYQRTDNEELKATIRFLMANYLGKAAFLNEFPKAVLSDETKQKYAEMLQLGMFTYGGMYHRTMDSMTASLRILKLEDSLGTDTERSMDMIPMDTVNVQSLFPVGFVVTPDLSKPDEMAKILAQQFEAHLDDFPKHHMEFPLLLDITEQMGQSLITNGDATKIEEYVRKQEEAKTRLNDVVKAAVGIIQKAHPNREDIQEGASDYLKMNLAVVSRTQVKEGIAVLNLHQNIFQSTDFDGKVALFDDPSWTARDAELMRQRLVRNKVKEWAGHTGIAINAVNFRKMTAEAYQDLTDFTTYASRATDYAVPGKVNVELYSSPQNFLEHRVFQSFADIATGMNPEAGPGQQLQAKATLAMIETLLNKIPPETWYARQQDPVVKELTQVALLRISQNLGRAANRVQNFREFSQAIDRAHSELTTLLALYQPFDPASFDKSYGQYIQPVLPAGMTPQTIGLARAAMNVFAGVNAAVLANNPSPVRICGAHSYYEEQGVVGESKTLDQALGDANIKKIDLYVAEFYHNIDIDPNHIHYEKGKVIQDIERIFTEKPETDSLTVAIDATIDLTNSQNVKDLLERFKDKIESGKLNFVFFRSGQKFDMMGLDNYFGSPFYIVNNGDKKWSEFNKIKTEEVFHTDPLSQQFFCLMAEAGPELVDAYKTLIFDNTRSIQSLVPDSLKAAPEKEFCVCDFDEDVKSSFIDIKIGGKDEDKQYELQNWVSTRLFEIFIEQDKLLYARGSFGFPHPNITWINPKMRINPGIDPQEIPLYQKFFTELAAKVEELDQRQAA